MEETLIPDPVYEEMRSAINIKIEYMIWNN